MMFVVQFDGRAVGEVVASLDSARGILSMSFADAATLAGFQGQGEAEEALRAMARAACSVPVGERLTVATGTGPVSGIIGRVSFEDEASSPSRYFDTARAGLITEDEAAAGAREHGVPEWPDEGTSDEWHAGVRYAMREANMMLRGVLASDEARARLEGSCDEWAHALAGTVERARAEGAYHVALMLGLASDEARRDGVEDGLHAITSAITGDVLVAEERARGEGRAEVRNAFRRALALPTLGEEG